MTGEEEFYEAFNGSMIRDPLLDRMRASSARDEDNLPILRKNSAALYRFLLTAFRPRRILEAGTCQGYSSILAARALADCGEEDFRIDTVELSEDNAEKALEHIGEAGFAGRIRVIPGDCVEVFQCLSGTYDLIFVDSSKSHYVDMYGDIVRLLKPGGLLICDDILFYGKALDDPENTPHKHRTIVTKLREFTDKVRDSGDFVGVIDTMDDGFLMAVKTRENKT